MCGRSGMPNTILYCGTCGGYWEQTCKRPQKQGPIKGNQEGSSRPKSRRPRGSQEKPSGKMLNSEEEFPHLVLPHKPPATNKKPEDEKIDSKVASATTYRSTPVPQTPPPGDLGSPQVFVMGSGLSATPTPRSLKAVEQPVEKEQVKETDGNEVGALAVHLQQMMLSGSLQLPEHLQSTVQQLSEPGQPKTANMFSLENQRRKWQKRLTQHQKDLAHSQEAWQKFLSEVTAHLAAKEEQFLTIKQQAEQGIEEAQSKINEIAQAMKDHIPKELESPEVPQPDPALQETASKLKDQLHQLQQAGTPPAPPAPTIQPEAAQVPAVDLVMSDGDAVSVPSGDEKGWEEVRHRSRSRTEGQNNVPGKRVRRKAKDNQNQQQTQAKQKR